MVISRLLVLSVAFGWATLSSGVFAQTKPTDKPKYGRQLAFGALRTFRTTNPFRNTYSLDYHVRSLMFEGLTGLAKNSELVPALAKGWEISKDGLTYTFALRNGVKFHNGKELNAEDVKWSIEYIMNPKNRAYYLDQFTTVQSVEAPNPATAVFKLKKPFSPLPVVVATARAPIVPAGAEISPKSYPAGTGPFRFVEWKPGDHMTLKAFKNYWVPGIPYLDQIIFRPIQDDSVRVTALKAKEIDIAEELPYSVGADARKRDLGFNIVHLEAGQRQRLVFNLRIPPFDNAKVRQAVAYALDKKRLAEGLTWDFATPINQRFPKSSKWFIDLKDREVDLEKAKALLAEVGYKNGLKIKVPVYPGPDRELTLVIANQLRRVGIELELNMMDWAAHSKVRRNREFTLYAAQMGGRASPHQMYYKDLYSKSQGNNSGYSNPEADRLLAQASQVLDFDERKRLYTRVMEIFLRDVPEIYLTMGPILMGVQPYVKGFSTGGMEERVAYVGGGLTHTWIDK